MLHKAIDALAGMLLVLLVSWRHKASKGIPLAAAGLPLGRRQGWVKLIFASADDGDSPRGWLKLIAPVFAGVLFGQLLNIGGCNTTPTQSRIANLEASVKELQDVNKNLDHVYEPREEIQHNSETITKLQAQRDERIARLEETTSQVQLFLMQRALP